MSALAIRSGGLAWPPLEGTALAFVVEARPDAPPPPDVLLVLDGSGSLAGPPGESARACARALAAAVHPGRRLGLVLAGSSPCVAVPLERGTRAACEAALARPLARGADTMARALELARHELRGGPVALVVVSDLAFGTAASEALARLEAQGAQVVLVEATSAFTPAAPARAPRARLGEDPGAAVPALVELVRAGDAPPAAGRLEVELAEVPLVWLSGEPLRASGPGVLSRASVPLEGGAARLACVVRSALAGAPGRARLTLADGPPEERELQAGDAPLDEAAALARAARGSA